MSLIAAKELARESFRKTQLPQAVVKNPFRGGYTVMTLDSARRNGLHVYFSASNQAD